MGRPEKTIFVLFLVSALADGLLTALGVARHSPHTEANPLLRAVFTEAGFGGAAFLVLQNILLTYLLVASRIRSLRLFGLAYAMAGIVGHTQGALTWLR